jgi:hypothetical protein
LIGEVDLREGEFCLDIFDHIVFGVTHGLNLISGRRVVADGFEKFLDLELPAGRGRVIGSFSHYGSK